MTRCSINVERKIVEIEVISSNNFPFPPSPFENKIFGFDLVKLLMGLIKGSVGYVMRSSSNKYRNIKGSSNRGKYYI